MKLAQRIIEKLSEAIIDKSNYKTLLRDGDRILTRNKKTGDKYQTLFVSQTNDGLVIRSGATNGDVLLTLKKPKITVGDLMRELDKKPHNWNTKNMEMSLNESMNEGAYSIDFDGKQDTIKSLQSAFTKHGHKLDVNKNNKLTTEDKKGQEITILKDDSIYFKNDNIWLIKSSVSGGRKIQLK